MEKVLLLLLLLLLLAEFHVRISRDVSVNFKFSLVVFPSRQFYCLALLLLLLLLFHSSTLLNIQDDSPNYFGLNYICLEWFPRLHLLLYKNGTQLSPFCSRTASRLLLLLSSATCCSGFPLFAFVYLYITAVFVFCSLPPHINIISPSPSVSGTSYSEHLVYVCMSVSKCCSTLSDA